MRRKELILQSPLRVVDRAIRGGLGKGRLGVILAPPGVGKSACLVQLGLDALLRDRPVLHVAIAQSVEHVSAWYDALFDDLAARADLVDRAVVRDAAARRRLIWSVRDGAAAAVGEALAAFRAHLGVDPTDVLVDGWAWEAPGCTAALAAVKASAARAGAELWMTARASTVRPERSEAESTGEVALAPLCAACAALVDVALSLEPHGRDVRVVLAKDGARFPAAGLPLVLEGGALRLAADVAGAPRALVDPGSCTLLASGSAGAEEEFGACAERWGVAEVNFTFAGRGGVARTRGLVELSEEELRLGEVSPAYVKAHLHRTFHEPRVLQAIWHQVSTAGEVFAIGTLDAGGTPHGGTGWAVELARHWRKPVHLFDEERRHWVRWDGRRWTDEAPPVVTRARFAGAGTRSPSADARAAIRALFERSFGSPAG